ncbi:putative Phosphatidylinositol-glycan biosynthesis class X protein [Hibiscus syriacus]|uniref:Phosphatidylinositol-glycan biosynthesis class X protein n=1 Tax=Hibiscus syriacus TaxID=106335 RepID=A0A6A2XIL0_HIBSY|nr:putative Phosphatidylinositol-glycan biosynthesis class X protein [Hibiscus syriacus]
MNSSSPANSSISTTAIVGGGGASGGTNAALDDFHFPSDLISIQDRKDEATLGLFPSFFPFGVFSAFATCIHYSLWVFGILVDAFSIGSKIDLMAALNEEVKSLDEDNWKFEGPRSRIHLISRPGGFLQKQTEFTTNRSMAPPK